MTVRMAASTVALAAAGLLSGLAGTAHAATPQVGTHPHSAATMRPECVADTDGDCWRPNYAVWRADSQGLAVWSGVGTGTIEDWLPNGTQVEVDCQLSGPAEDGLPYQVWDRLDDGSYVYDYYITTPAPDGQFSVPPLTFC